MSIFSRQQVRRIPALEVRGDAAVRLDKLYKELGTESPNALIGQALAVLEAVSRIAGKSREATVSNANGDKLTVKLK